MAHDDTAALFSAAPPLKRFLLRNAVSLVGIGLLISLIALCLALATWHASDPSLSHATGESARNLMGTPGAVASDLAMQLFGLGVLGLLVPLFAIAWRVASCRRIPGILLRIIALILGASLFSAGLDDLPAPAAWPLPVGLGGVLGDRIAALVHHLSNGTVGAVVLVLTPLVGFLLLLAAAPFDWRAPLALLRSRRVGAVRSDDEGEAWDEAPADMADAPGRGGWLSSLIDVSAGAFAHWRLRAGSAAAKRAHVRREPEPWSADDEPEVADIYAPDPDADDALDASPPAEEPLDDEIASALAGDGIAVPPPPAVAPTTSPIPQRRRAPAPRAAAGGVYEKPSLDLLTPPSKQERHPSMHPEALQENAHILEGVLEDFGVKGEIIGVQPGPVVTLYELEPAPGIKSSRVIGLADDIARSMSAIAARVAVVPGRNVIGIELPNAHRETVFMREILDNPTFDKTKQKLALTLGKTIGGEPVIADLAKMPHLLVAGTTGSGKSVSVNTMILSLLYRLTPEQCRLIMIDPKMLELSIYDGIPHLLAPVVTDPKKAVVALKWTVREMEDRYKKMSKVGVRNIDGFNQRVAQAKKRGEIITRTVQTGFDHETGEAVFESEELELETMPYIVVIIDEMADLMMVAGKEIEGTVQRLAQMARAAGIHVVMATQRPSVDVITGTIKANFPTRISFQVTSKIDSRTILGEQGAEQLLGMGDMLYMAGGGRTQRVHGPFVSDEEVEDVVAHLKAQGVPDYLDAVTEDDGEDDAGSGSGGAASGGGEDSDDPYDQAVAVVLRDRKVSTSYIQRRLSIGYNRAASLIERMEKEGVISAANHAGKREILVPEQEEA